MREQNETRNCVAYTQRVFTKRHNRVNIAKCLYKINETRSTIGLHILHVFSLIFR